MTFEDLKKANATIKTTNIKGKEYAEVNQRIKAFRMLYPEGFIVTQIVSNDDGVCVMRAEVGINDADGKAVVLGTGTAYEKESASMINRTSYIENCETSAVGRALGMAGFGIDTSVASYEEVKNAISQQEAAETKIDEVKIAALTAQAKQNKVPVERILEAYKVQSLADLTVGNFIAITKNWKKVKEWSDKQDAGERND